jgi:hypothetical protein
LAAEFRLPAIYPFRSFVEAGGLMAHGVDLTELFRQDARSIGKILTRAKPGDIPYYQPTKFELLINLKAAKELGFTVPPSMLSLADELIESRLQLRGHVASSTAAETAKRLSRLPHRFSESGAWSGNDVAWTCPHHSFRTINRWILVCGLVTTHFCLTAPM